MKNKYEVCPVSQYPSNDCYCVGMNSHKIAMAVEICIGNYSNCSIYLAFCASLDADSAAKTAELVQQISASSCEQDSGAE